MPADGDGERVAPGGIVEVNVTQDHRIGAGIDIGVVALATFVVVAQLPGLWAVPCVAPHDLEIELVIGIENAEVARQNPQCSRVLLDEDDATRTTGECLDSGRTGTCEQVPHERTVHVLTEDVEERFAHLTEQRPRAVARHRFELAPTELSRDHA